MRAAIATGALLEPAANNARARLLAMRELNRTSPQTLAVQHDLLLALLRRAQAAIGRQDLEAAQQTSPPPRILAAKRNWRRHVPALDTAVGAKRGAEAARPRRRGPARQRTGTDPKAAAAAAAILSPKPSRTHAGRLPTLGSYENVQGYVIVEFMLNPNGSASAVSRRVLAPAYLRQCGAGCGQACDLLHQ